MTYKKIESSRNKRLWITQVLLPAATLATTVVISIPEAKESLVKTTVQTKKFIKEKFNKKESKNDKKVVISINVENRQEALKALEVLAKEVMETNNADEPINKKVRVKVLRKV